MMATALSTLLRNRRNKQDIFIQFYTCVSRLQLFKENVRLFLQFFGNVTIDVNGKRFFSKFPTVFKLLYMKNAKSENFIKNLIYCFIHSSFK